MSTVNINVTVIMDPQDNPQITDLAATERVSVRAGDTIIWNFENQWTNPLILGIGNLHSVTTAEAEYPLDPDAAVMVRVPAATDTADCAKGTLSIAIRSDIKYTDRVYKYDIIDYTNLRTLLDPEIEIPR